MSSHAPPTSESEATFVCACDESMRVACLDEPFYKEHEGKQYCVLHFPGKEKCADFKAALGRKYSKDDFDFRGVWFPDEEVLASYKFRNDVNFSHATFNAPAYFGFIEFGAKADFSHAIFNAKARINGVFMTEANFLGATFNDEVDFGGSTFCDEACFSFAQFNNSVEFRSTFEAKADFYYATFRDYVRFSGYRPALSSGSSLELQFARIGNPHRVSFHTSVLRPSWFINVDARKFDFINIDWDWRGINEEIASLRSRDVSSPHRLLALASRHLAVNAEDNHRYEEASKFRYMAMDAIRRERWRGFAFWKLSWWYWLASGYGERMSQGLLVLLGILLLFALAYSRVGFARWEPNLASERDASVAKRDVEGAPLPFKRALTYSAGVMTFQRPEPRPATTMAQTLVLLETILGPIQAALLALAIRRKFMR